MATRINTNVGAMLATLNLNKSFQNAQNSIAKLSSGLRINRAGDDPGGVIIYNKLKSDAVTWEVASRNSNEGVAALQVADSGASRISDLLTQMKTLAEGAASGTATASSRAAASDSFEQLEDEVDSIANTMKYGTLGVLTGDLRNVKFQVGISTASTVQLVFTAKAAGGASGSLDTSNIGSNTGYKMTFASIGASGITTQTNALRALTYIDRAIDQTGVFRGDIGAMQSTLEAAASAANTAMVNLHAAASAVGDVDFASEVANFTQSSILAQAGLAFMAQANLLNQSVLALIG